MEQALLGSKNVVQYCNQNKIAFVLPPALPENRELLMNGGGLLPVKAGMQQSSHDVFKQSGLKVWDVLQIRYTTCTIRCLGSLILAKLHALLHMMTTHCSRFCTWRGSIIMIHWSVPAVFQ